MRETFLGLNVYVHRGGLVVTVERFATIYTAIFIKESEIDYRCCIDKQQYRNGMHAMV